MSVLEKNGVLIFKNNQGNTVILCPFTRIENVLGAVARVNGVTPDDGGNVVIAIPSKVSDLTNDSGYLTAVPDEYITEAELNNKNYALKSELPDVSDVTSRVTALEDKTSIIDSAKRISTSRITATQGLFAQSKIQLTTTQLAVGSGFSVNTNNGNLTTSGSVTATGGFVGNLTGNADTATKTMQDGDGNVITATYAVKAEIPTKVSQLENDSGYLTEFSEIYVNAINKNTQDITGLQSTVSSLAPITMVQGVSTRVAVVENKTNNMSFKDDKTTFSGTVQGTFVGSLAGTASNAVTLNNISASLYALKADIPDVSNFVSIDDLSQYEERIALLEKKISDITKYFWLTPEN